MTKVKFKSSQVKSSQIKRLLGQMASDDIEHQLITNCKGKLGFVRKKVMGLMLVW